MTAHISPAAPGHRTPSGSRPAAAAAADGTRERSRAPAIEPVPDDHHTGPADRRARIGIGALLVLDGLLSFAPVAVLGAAIGWPASLGNPAATQLAAIAAAPEAVALGYGLYLLYSMLIAPLMVGVAWVVWGSLARPAAATVAVLAGASALARSIGILRWLTVMPTLATAHAAATPDARAGIELLFDALNDYGGGIGEVLGVSLFMALALGIAGVAAWRRRTLPRPIAALGVVGAIALAGLAPPVFGAPVAVPVAAAVSIVSLWMIAAGVWLAATRGRG